MALRIGGSAESDRYKRGGRNYNPFLGQQQPPQLSMSIPMGGFMGQNQIGGQSAINIYRAPEPKLTPEQRFEDRAAQYQQDVAKFNLGQKEAELEKRRAGAEEIASGRNMLNGQAVTRAEMDQYMQRVKESGARAQADFDRENPFYSSVKASMEPSPTRIKDIFGRFSESEEAYSDRLEEYLSPANKQAREQQFSQKLNESRTSALRNSINQFRKNPMSYLMGGGEDGSTYSPDALMGYLGQANQLFKATGQEGNFMDFILGRSGGIQKRVVKPLSSLLMGRTEDEIADINYSNEARYMSKYRADVESGRISDRLNLLEKDKQAARIKLRQEGENLSPSEMRNLLNIINAKTLKVKY